MTRGESTPPPPLPPPPPPNLLILAGFGPPPPPKGLIYQAKRHRTHPNTYFALKQRKLQLEKSSFRDEPEIVPLDRAGIVLLSGYQTAESYLQNFVVVYSDPLHKEKIVCFGRPMTA